MFSLHAYQDTSIISHPMLNVTPGAVQTNRYQRETCQAVVVLPGLRSHDHRGSVLSRHSRPCSTDKL